MSSSGGTTSFGSASGGSSSQDTTQERGFELLSASTVWLDGSSVTPGESTDLPGKLGVWTNGAKYTEDQQADPFGGFDAYRLFDAGNWIHSPFLIGTTIAGGNYVLSFYAKDNSGNTNPWISVMEFGAGTAKMRRACNTVTGAMNHTSDTNWISEFGAKVTDGWHYFEVAFSVDEGWSNPELYLGASNAFISDVKVTRRRVVNAVNKSRTGETFTQANTQAQLSAGYASDRGWLWSSANLPALVSSQGYVSQSLSIPVAASTLSGIDHQFSLIWVVDREKNTVGDLIRLEGLAAELRIGETSSGELVVSRKGNNGAVQTVTSIALGLGPQVLGATVSEKAVTFYRQGSPIATSSLETVGVSTFTVANLLGELNGQIQSIALFSNALEAADVLAVSKSLGKVASVPLSTLKVWLLVGQSNAYGTGSPNGIIPRRYRHQREHRLAWSSGVLGGAKTIRTFGALQPLLVSQVAWPFSESIGFECAIGYSKTDSPIAIAKAAISGSGVKTHWLDDVDGVWTWAQRALDEELLSLGIPYEIVGIIHVGGEQDAAELSTASNYARNVEQLVTNIETRFGFTGRVVLNKLHSGCSSTYTSIVRSQQDSLVTAFPSKYVLVNFDDLVLVDGLHFDSASYWTGGQRIGELL